MMQEHEEVALTAEQIELLRAWLIEFADALRVAWETIFEWLEKNAGKYLKILELDAWERQERRRGHPNTRAPVKDQRSWRHDVRAMNTRHYIRRSFPV